MIVLKKLFQYYVLINIDPVNKLYCFDWIILISAEYVVYIMCVISVIVD